MRERTFHQYAANDDQVIYENNQIMKSRTPSSYEDLKPEQFFHTHSHTQPVIEYRA